MAGSFVTTRWAVVAAVNCAAMAWWWATLADPGETSTIGFVVGFALIIAQIITAVMAIKGDRRE